MSLISKTHIVQSIRGAAYPLPLNLLMLLIFIGVVRVLDSTSSTVYESIGRLDDFELLVRLTLFVPPAIFSAIMATVKRTQPEKRLFWLAATIFQILLFALIQPNFNM